MKYLLKTHFFGLLFCLIQPLHAQQYLKLNYDCKNNGAAFNQVYVIDKRAHGQLLGYVQKGAFNRLEAISFKGNLADSLSNFFQASHHLVAAHGKDLVLILEELFMSEHTGAFSEEGKLKLSLRIFISAGNERFKQLQTLDTIFYTKGLDVTHKMLRSVSEQFCAIAADAGNMSPTADTTYSLNELAHLDSLEMRQIPIFVSSPKSGIYNSYKSFKNNMPDIPSEIGIDHLNAGKVSVYSIEHTRKGKLKKVYIQKSTGVYAVSDGQDLIKYFEDGWYKITKGEDGFYFDSRTSFSNNAAMWGAALGGIAGAMIADNISSKSMYHFKINQRTGRSILIRLVE